MDSDKAESVLLAEAWLIKLGGWQRIKGSVGLFLCPQGVVCLLSFCVNRKLAFINCQVSVCVGLFMLLFFLNNVWSESEGSTPDAFAR